MPQLTAKKLLPVACWAQLIVPAADPAEVNIEPSST